MGRAQLHITCIYRKSRKKEIIKKEIVLLFIPKIKLDKHGKIDFTNNTPSIDN